MVNFIPHTQTNLDPGNCWQTCLASILAVELDSLPPQIEYDRWESHPEGGRRWIGRSYMAVIGIYLRKHHQLAYVEMHHPEEIWQLINVKPHVLHMMTGKTVRSSTNGELRHVVVAQEGKLFWDPHPSRAGLTEDINHAFLIPFPKIWEETWNKNMNDPCVCRACEKETAT